MKNMLLTWLLPGLVLAGCTTTHTNQMSVPRAAGPEASAPSPVPPDPLTRATFKVDADRGNPRVLTYLALSGGGSRAAYFSGRVMLALQTVFDDVDLLDEIDVMSAVSGGAMAAAYYASTRDSAFVDQALARRLGAVELTPALAARLAVDPAGPIDCTAELTPTEVDELQARAAPRSVRRLVNYCADRSLSGMRLWDDATVTARMRKNYLLPWFGRWFLPQSFLPYWFGAKDRSDIMAEVFANNLYSKGLLNSEMTMADLNPRRPYLILNATSATQREDDDPLGKTDPPFGSVFTFTAEDFSTRLDSRVDTYSVARAVMGSAAFPLVFQNMTLADYRADHGRHCDPNVVADPPCQEQRYLHIFDGGNSDNLGLHSVKRSILEQLVDTRRPQPAAIVVLLVDAITRPRGADPHVGDPRSLISFIADLNVTDAVDSLLKVSHDRMIGSFLDGRLEWKTDCEPESRNLPKVLCDRLRELPATAINRFARRIVFMHIGFEDVDLAVRAGQLDQVSARRLKLAADAIPTSFRLADKDAETLDAIARSVIHPSSICLQLLRKVYLAEPPEDALVALARDQCTASVPSRILDVPRPAN